MSPPFEFYRKVRGRPGAARACPPLLRGGSRKPHGHPAILGASLLGRIAGERILLAEPLRAQDTRCARRAPRGNP